MNKYLLPAILLSTLLFFSCEDTPDDETKKQCRSGCSVNYELRLTYCSETYPSGSEELDECEQNASKDLDECMEGCN